MGSGQSSSQWQLVLDKISTKLKSRLIQPLHELVCTCPDILYTVTPTERTIKFIAIFHANLQGVMVSDEMSREFLALFIGSPVEANVFWSLFSNRRQWIFDPVPLDNVKLGFLRLYYNITNVPRRRQLFAELYWSYGHLCSQEYCQVCKEIGITKQEYINQCPSSARLHFKILNSGRSEVISLLTTKFSINTNAHVWHPAPMRSLSSRINCLQMVPEFFPIVVNLWNKTKIPEDDLKIVLPLVLSNHKSLVFDVAETCKFCTPLGGHFGLSFENYLLTSRTMFGTNVGFRTPAMLVWLDQLVLGIRTKIKRDADLLLLDVLPVTDLVRLVNTLL